MKAIFKNLFRADFRALDSRLSSSHGENPHLRVFANETATLEPLGNQATEIGARVECIANAGSGPMGADGFMRIAAYGDHPYGQEDIQAFDRDAAESMARRFKVAANGVVRALFRTSPGQPVYYGHPDHPQFSMQGHDDFTLRAEITEMEARDDGLYVRPVFTDAGNELLRSGEKLFWSPRWVSELVRKAADGRRVWRPFKLLSAGLTPTPNIYGSAANAQPNPKQEYTIMKNWIKKLLIRLGFSEDQANAAVASGEGAPAEAEIEKRLHAQLDAANAHATLTHELRDVLGLAADAQIDVSSIGTRLSAVDQANASLTAAQTEAAKAKQEIEKLRADFANERQARATLIVERALEDGRLTAAEKAAKIDALAKAADFANAANAVLTAAKVMPAGGKSADLGQRKGEMADQANAREQFNAALKDFANDQGLDLDHDYQRTYGRFKLTAKGKELLEAMGRKEGE